MDEFRRLLGDQLNTTTGVTGGRRRNKLDEDCTGCNGRKNLPLDFFNPTAPGSPSRSKGVACRRRAISGEQQ